MHNILFNKFRFYIIIFLSFTLPFSACNSALNAENINITYIDPFENLNISFHGNPDEGFADIDSSECSDIVKQNFKFVCNNDGNLSNGDFTTISAIKTSQNNLNILRYQKNYIITGVDFYSTEIYDYDKDILNKAIRKFADDFINNNIQDFHMVYYSDLDRTGWSKSGSFNYTYNYYDMKMFYNIHKNDKSKNAYFILYELENEINCVEDMDNNYPAPMKKGEVDTGVAYVVVGAKSVKATSNKIFKDDISEIITMVFDTKDDAESYCTYGGEYDTLTELFV